MRSQVGWSATPPAERPVTTRWLRFKCWLRSVWALFPIKWVGSVRCSGHVHTSLDPLGGAAWWCVTCGSAQSPCPACGDDLSVDRDEMRCRRCGGGIGWDGERYYSDPGRQYWRWLGEVEDA